MISIFIKRFLRYIKQNLAKSIGLFVMTAVIVAVYTALVSTSFTILDGRENNSANENIQSGSFSLVVPMTNEQLVSVSNDSNATVSENFYFDIEQGEFVFRIFKTRQKINLPVLKKGTFPKSSGEIIIEQTFAEANNLDVGDSFSVGGFPFVISGYGCVSDYTYLSKGSSSNIKNFNTFSWIIMSDEDYQALLNADDYKENFEYSFILEGSKPIVYLQESIRQLLFDYNEYALNNNYFREYIQDQIDVFNDLRNETGINRSQEIQDTVSGAFTVVSDFYNALTDGESQLQNLFNSINNNTTLNNEQFDNINSVLADINAQLQSYSNQVFTLYSKITQSNILSYFPDSANISVSLNFYINNLINVCSQFSSRNIFIKSLSKNANNMKYYLKEQLDDLSILNITVSTFKNIVLEIQDYIDFSNMSAFNNIDAENILLVKKLLLKSINFTDSRNSASVHNDTDYALLYKKAGLAYGALLLVLLSFIFAVFNNHQIKKEHKIIGTCCALGVSRLNITLFYLLPSLIISLLGGAVGLILGCSKPLMELSLNAFHLGNSFPYYTYSFPPIIYIYALCLPVVINLLVNLLSIKKTFKQSAVSLMHDTVSEKQKMHNTFKKVPFVTRFALRNTSREVGIFSILGISIVISLVFLMVGLNTYVVPYNAYNLTQNNCKYDYVYILKYPKSDLNVGGEKAVCSSFNTYAYGSQVNILTFGLSKDNIMELSFEPEQNSCIVSTAVLTKTGLKVGDYLHITDDLNENAFDIKIAKSVPNGGNIEMYFDIDCLRNMLGVHSAFYNALLSNERLEIDGNLISSFINKQTVLENYLAVSEIIMPFVMLSLIGSSVLFIAVVYLIYSMLIDKNQKGISLIKVLGYSSSETQKMYIRGAEIFIVILLAVCVPLAKLFSNFLCKYIYNKLAIGLFFGFPFFIYAIIISIALVIMFTILNLIVIKVKKIDPHLIIKNID